MPSSRPTSPSRTSGPHCGSRTIMRSAATRSPKTVLDIDRQLADIGRSFDLLLQATPVNAESAWREFRRSRFEKPPVFYYRPLAIDPALLKRQLYLIPVERIDDPTLSYSVPPEAGRARSADHAALRRRHAALPAREPADLRRRLRLAARSTPSELLDRVPTRSREESARQQLHATEFAKRAQQELGYYQQQCADFAATVAVRDDMYAGMMVSGDQLLDRRQDSRAAAARRRAAAARNRHAPGHALQRPRPAVSAVGSRPGRLRRPAGRARRAGRIPGRRAEP